MVFKSVDLDIWRDRKLRSLLLEPNPREDLKLDLSGDLRFRLISSFELVRKSGEECFARSGAFHAKRGGFDGEGDLELLDVTFRNLLVCGAKPVAETPGNSHEKGSAAA